jgi:competence protein ComEC
MSGGGDAQGSDAAGWFVRRAGLARFTTFACAFGVALSAFIGAKPTFALVGLTTALLGALAGTLWGRSLSRPAHGTGSVPEGLSQTAAWLLLLSILSVGAFTGYLVGGLRVAALMDGALQSRVGETVEAELCLTGQVRAYAGWHSVAAVVRTARAPDSEGGQELAARALNDAVGDTVLLEVPPPEDGAASPTVLQQGMVVIAKGSIEQPDGPSASGYDQARYLLHQGIEVVFRAEGGEAVTVLGYRGGFSGWFDRLRAAAQSHLALGPSAPVNEVLQGVVMGDTVGIDKGWMTAFRRSGTAHMLSVSGLHVASLAGIVMALTRLAGAARWVGFVLAMAAALLMIPFVGASPPIVRAAAMICVVLSGRWLGRGRDQWQVLGLAAIVVLALNPFAIFDVGFQLSFAAFLGLLSLLGPLERLLRRLPAGIGSNAAVSVAASAGTAPVSLAVFDQASLVSPLANLLVVPTLPVVTGLGMASAFLGFAWGGLSVALSTLASLPMMWTVQVSRLMAVAPVLGVGDLGRALFAVLAAVIALPVALALMGRTVRPPPWMPLQRSGRMLAWVRAHRPRRRRMAAALAVALVVAGVAVGAGMYPAAVRGWEALESLAPGRGWPDAVEVRVLDVGQGNAVLVRTPERHALLFDGGPADCDLGGQLRALGVRTLDLVVISHPHADHFAGLLASLQDLKVDVLIDQVQVTTPAEMAGRAGAATGGGTLGAPGSTAKDEGAGEAVDYLRLRRHLAEDGCRYSFASTGHSVTVDGLVVRFFAQERPLTLVTGPEPWSARGGEPSGEELNASSLVAVVSIGGLDVLIPGDAEAEVLQRYDLPPCDLIVVPHHGSRGAVTDRLLSALGSRVAVVSVGEGNYFGHPHADTMAITQQSVGTVLRTDQAGWVSCKVNGDAMVITTERTPSR